MNPIFDRFVNQRKKRKVYQLDLFDSNLVVEVVSDPEPNGSTRHSVMYRSDHFTEVPQIDASAFSLRALRRASVSVPSVVTAHGGDPLTTMSIVNRNISKIDFTRLRDDIAASRKSKTE